MGYCPKCGEKISELHKVSYSLSRVHLEDGHLVYYPDPEREKSWVEYVCPECKKILTRDGPTAEDIMKMSQLEARSFEILRNRRPEDYIEEI